MLRRRFALDKSGRRDKSLLARLRVRSSKGGTT
jgi:hypothetical protein